MPTIAAPHLFTRDDYHKMQIEKVFRHGEAIPLEFFPGEVFPVDSSGI